MNALESVNMDIHLDIHERMIDNMGASLSKTKKRLYDAELTMNLRPSDNDPLEVEEWDAKVDSLISTRDQLLFPKLYLVKREHEEMAAVASKKKSMSINEWNVKANETLINQIDHLQQRILNRGEQHTSKQTGTVIRTINNYRGTLFKYSKLVFVYLLFNVTILRSKQLPPGQPYLNSKGVHWLGADRKILSSTMVRPALLLSQQHRV
jgi:hypothetical protein